MMEQKIRERYFSLLKGFLARSEDVELNEAAELGRELMLTGIPLAEVAKMHKETVARLANEAPEMTISDAVRSTTAPLNELITAYDLSFRESESLYRLLAENVTDVIWTVDMNLRYTYISPSIERLTGYTVKETMSQTLEEILTPTSLEHAMKVFREESASEETGHTDLHRERMIEVEFKCKDGSTVWAETRANFLRDQNGQAIGILGVTRDITERKRSENLLRIQHDIAVALGQAGSLTEVLNELLKVVCQLEEIDSGGVYLVDKVTGELNLAAHRGLSAQFVESISQTAADFYITRNLMNGLSLYLDYSGLKQAASIPQFEGLHALASIPIQYEDQVIAVLNLASHTYNEIPLPIRSLLEAIAAQTGGFIVRMEVQEALRESEDRYKSISDVTVEGLIIHDKGVMVDGNSALAKMFGYELEELIGRDLIELLDIPKSRGVIRRNIAAGTATPYEVMARRKDGTMLPLEVEARQVLYRGKPLRVAAVRDITERKRSEKLLLEQYNLGAALSRTSDLEEAMRLCLEVAIRASGMDCGGLYLRDEISGSLELKFHKGLTPDLIKVASHYDVDSPNTRLVMEGKPIYTQHLKLGVPIDEVKRREGLHALAVIPIRHEDKVIGCLNIGSHVLDEVSIPAQQALETIAVQVGGVIARLKAGEAVRESEKRYRLLAENVTDVIWSVDADLKFTYISPSVERMLGYTDEEVMSMAIKEVLAPASFEVAMEVFKEEIAIEEQEVKDLSRVRMLELELKCKDGSTVWVEANMSALRDQANKFNGVLGVSRDITERKRAEEAVRNAAAEWRSTFDTMPDIVMLLDRDQRIIRANRALIEAMGLTFEEILGKKCYQFLHGTNVPPASCLSARAIADRKEYTEEVYYERLDRDFHVVVTPFLDSSGTLTGAVHVMRDITELKKVQRELQEKERLAMMGEIAGGIAHEIKNPLFAVTSGIQVLGAEIKLNRAQKGTFNIILKEIMRVDRLIRELLDFTARKKIQRTSCQIKALINEVISLNEGLLRSGKIKIKKTLPKDMPPVYADRDRVTQVLVNLLQNAIDASRPGDVIELGCGIDEDKRCVVIRVKDKGPGIPKEQRQRIFNPFVSTKKGSSGMGLAISKKIVMEHDGNIWVEPRKKGGAVIVVELPFAAA